MKLIATTAAMSFLSLISFAQDFSGYRAGNYGGVNAVFFNPANIADSRYRWDVNVVSFSAFVGNDKASFKLKDIGKTFNEDSLKTQLFGENAGPSSGMFSMNILGPSVMFSTSNKLSFALTTRGRVFANVNDIDGKLVNKLMNDFKADPSLPYAINSTQNMQLKVNAWTEIGASVARVLVENGHHFLKGGLTLKYLAGAANGYMFINQFKGTINDDAIAQDAYLNNSTGAIGMGFGGVRIEEFEAGDLTAFESTGFGGDLGFVYEFRPGFEQNKGDSKYKFRFGLALLDIGTIKYNRDISRSGSYNIDITGAERLYFKQLDNVDVDDYKSFFDSRPQFFTPVAGNNEKDYKVGLPTTLQLDADYHFLHGLYLSIAGQIAMSKSDDKPYNPQYYSGFTVTPRFEGRRFGIYLPASYNELTKFNAGVSLRYGPVFIGSGSALTALFGSKQADLHFGLRFGGLQKNAGKKKKEHAHDKEN